MDDLTWNLNDVVEKVRKIDEILAQFPKHLQYTFWCPKDFSKNKVKCKGYTLYIYGGHVLDIFVDDKSIIYSKVFGEDYYEFFNKDRELIEKACKELSKTASVKNTDIILQWDNKVWDAVFKAMNNRAENIDVSKNDKVYLERARQNAIAHGCSTIPEKIQKSIIAVNMEAEIYSASKDGMAKADLVTVSIVNKIPRISYIEYKCTDGGIDGVSLRKHYDDMQSYYNDSGVREKIQEYFERIMLLQGTSVKGIKWELAKSEIVFLFTHVKRNLTDSKRELSVSKVASHIKRMEQSVYFPQANEKVEHIKFWILKDEKESIYDRKEFTYDMLKKALNEVMAEFFTV